MAHVVDNVTVQDSNIIKTLLEIKQAVLVERLARIKKDSRLPHSSDWSEQAAERENDEVLDALGNEAIQELQLVKNALMHIENGTYGICTKCHVLIPAARLNAHPEATLCIACA